MNRAPVAGMQVSFWFGLCATVPLHIGGTGAAALELRPARASLAAAPEERGYEMHGTWISDPDLWLEDDSPEVVAWSDERDRAGRKAVDTPTTAELEARIAEILGRDRISAPQRFGDRNFFSRFGSDDSKTVYVFEEDGVEVVWLDTNQLNGSVSVVVPSWDGRKACYKYHPHRNDVANLIVLDLSGAAPWRVLADLPGARYGEPSWTPGNDGFFFTFLPPKPDDMPTADHSGLQTVVHYKLTNETRVVVPPSHDPKQLVGATVTRDGRFLLRSRSDGWDQTHLHVLRLDDKYAANGSWEALSQGPGVFKAIHHAGTFFLLQRGGGAPRGRVLSIPETSLSSQEELIPERDDVLRVMDFIGGHLILRYIQDVRSYFEVRDLKGRLVRSAGLPDGAANAVVEERSFALLPVEGGRGLGVIHGFSGEPSQARAFFYVQSPLHPPAVLSFDVPGGDFELWHQETFPPNPKAERFSVSQIFAENDGVRVPAVLVRPEKPGPVRTILYGYGGFDLIYYPIFRANALAWAELGNAFVTANLRGGGEYGQRWHENGMGLRKQNVFDDFAAVARLLIATDVTTPSQLMAIGKSNGGLLVGAAITQHPELFGAATISAPLLDMLRYTELVDSGKDWIPELGDPQNATEFANLLSYSPYHHVREAGAARYPAVLLETSAADDRVSPAHARKFFARLDAAGHHVWLRVRSGGHGRCAHGTRTLEEQARSMAETLGFGMMHLASRAEAVGASAHVALGLLLLIRQL